MSKHNKNATATTGAGKATAAKLLVVKWSSIYVQPWTNIETPKHPSTPKAQPKCLHKWRSRPMPRVQIWTLGSGN